MLNLDSIVSYREDIDTTDIDGDKVMMDLEKGQYFALYDVDRETCEKSVMEFIEGLDNAGLLSSN